MPTSLTPASLAGQPEIAINSLAAILPTRSRWGGDLFVMALALAAATAFVAPIQHNSAAPATQATVIFSTPDHCLGVLPGEMTAGASANNAGCAAWPAFSGAAELPWSAAAAQPVLLAK